MIRISLIIILAASVLVSCRHDRSSDAAKALPDGNSMIEMNRYMITKDRELIQNFCERKGIDARETGTGLWYSVITTGDGRKVSDGDVITFDYECSLLDGTLCYTSAGSGPKTTRLGYSTMESGLLEGIKMMDHGSEYIFIIPPYLAHGVPGDGDRIPGRSVIVYRIKMR